MHIPDHLLDSKTAGSLGLAAAAVLGMALHKVRHAITALAKVPALAGVGNGVKSIGGRARRVLSDYGQHYLTKVALVTSLVFSAQMFNFPIQNGTSGHLLGGVLAAMLLGPWGGMLAISTVLIVQSFFFADGGIIALGANIFNMGIVGCILGYYIYVTQKSMKVSTSLSIAIAAWFSVVLASACCSLEIGVSIHGNILQTLLAMFQVHALIGIGEATITLVLIELIKKFMGWELYNNGK